MSEEYIIVGYAIAGDNGTPQRTMQQKNWYDENRSATPAKIYKTEKVAARYGIPIAVYIKQEINDAPSTKE